MASSEILSQTLLSISNLKLNQLDIQKRTYEDGRKILEDEAAAESNDAKRAGLLVAGAKKLPTMSSASDPRLISGDNFERFAQQARHDPSIKSAFFKDYEASVRRGLDAQTDRYAYASLYGKLVKEWVSLGKQDGMAAEDSTRTASREEARAQRVTWEDYAFTAKHTDGTAIKSYLTSVFESDKVAKAYLAQIRDSMQSFQGRWDSKTHFDIESLRSTIKGMLRSNVLSDVKRAALNDFLGNEIVLSEVVDILTMRMRTRHHWQWEGHTTIEQLRNLNGRYRFYPDEDLLQSVFIHYIGMKWAVQLRDCFSNTKVLNHATWLLGLDPADEQNIEYFQKPENRFARPGSVADLRWRHFRDGIFLDQLPASFGEQRDAYGSGDTAQDGDTRESHLDVTQKLLRCIQADALLQTRLGAKFTVVRSDFKWFGPSIPHSSIVAVLEFFGVQEDWIKFFIKVLEAPIRFKHDPDEMPSRMRRRGTPISTPLADVFGEALLFCVDFAVNQRPDGAVLYRLHDDMWLWGDQSRCRRSWQTLIRCASLPGLEVNEDKTGSVVLEGYERVGRAESTGGIEGGVELQEEVDQPLPEGDVVWGFLKLDPLTGRFLISQAEVDKHIQELRVQLDACKSVLDWIQAWNTYGVRFFANFFGKPANCHSRQHVDSILENFQRIQEELFPDTPGGAGGHLKSMIAERFGIAVADIPDGFVYFPVELGGLGLKNPFVDLCLIRESVEVDPAAVLDKYFDDEEDTEYLQAKSFYEDTQQAGAASCQDAIWGSKRARWMGTGKFLTREEYTRHAERVSPRLGKAWSSLIDLPRPKDLAFRGEVRAAIDAGQRKEMSSYDKWVVTLYHREMLARFGCLNVVEKGMLPMGLMTMLRESKFQWVG